MVHSIASFFTDNALCSRRHLESLGSATENPSSRFIEVASLRLPFSPAPLLFLLHPGAFVVLLMEQTLRHRGAEAIFQLESVRLAASGFLPINSSISLHLFLDKSVLANGHCRRRKIILSASLQRIVAIISFEYRKHYRKIVLVVYLLVL